MVPKKNLESNFVIAIKDGDDGREQITLYSPYIQKVFRAVIRYFFQTHMPRRMLISMIDISLKFTLNLEASASVFHMPHSTSTWMKCKSI